MKFTTTFSCVALLIGLAAAQPPDSLWGRSYGGELDDICWSVLPVADGGFLMAGWTESYGAGDSDFWLLRTTADGDSLWSHAYGSEAEDMGFTMCQATDDGYMLAGVSSASGSEDFWLIKVDSDGTPLWDRRYGGPLDDRCWSIQQTTDGGYILLGWTSSYGAGSDDTWLLKVDSEGDSLWSRTFGGSSIDFCYEVKQTSDGGYILTGYTGSFGAVNHDIWLIKTDANGDSLWTRMYGGSEQEEARSVVQTPDGGYLIAGWGRTLTPGNTNFIAIRTDANGDSLWGRTYGGEASDFSNTARPVMGGGYVIAGRSYSFANGLYDIWMLRINEAGDSLWSASWGGPDADHCISLLQLPDASFVLAGLTSTEGAGLQFYLQKTTPDPLPIDDYRSSQPLTVSLTACPNPFNSEVRIMYSLPQTDNVTLSVYNLQGQLVEHLLSERATAGEYSITWQPQATSGIYFVRLQTGVVTATQKVLYLR
ncbi:T9SS type A sorting domain-containing protein [bacterium]|nr:T9SS type A sorting domain-containing protein [bacterium]MBU1636755.1 T9SS type A sorting domain-containing protein [bacterium]MBU1921452.1 T9SS type A sorting domain-containing protein [bacterium]